MALAGRSLPRVSSSTSSWQSYCHSFSKSPHSLTAQAGLRRIRKPPLWEHPTSDYTRSPPALHLLSTMGNIFKVWNHFASTSAAAVTTSLQRQAVGSISPHGIDAAVATLKNIRSVAKQLLDQCCAIYSMIGDQIDRLEARYDQMFRLRARLPTTGSRLLIGRQLNTKDQIDKLLELQQNVLRDKE